MSRCDRVFAVLFYGAAALGVYLHLVWTVLERVW